MIKRTLAFITVLTIALSLCACSGKKGGSPAQTDAPPQTAAAGKTEGAAELWQTLKGVWVSYTEDKYYFLQFTEENGEYGVYYGLLDTSFGRVGTLEELQKTAESSYTLSVFFDAVPASELDEGSAAYNDDIVIDTVGLAEKTLLVTLSSPGDTMAFDLLGDTLEQAAEALQGARGRVSPQELWNRLAGVWVCTDPGERQYYFIEFTTAGGANRFNLGILASGFGESGELTELEQLSDSEYRLHVHFDAVAATEMDGAREAYDAAIALNTAGAAEKTLLVKFDVSESEIPFDLLGATTEEAAENSGIYG